jgi:hypothetical protein
MKGKWLAWAIIDKYNRLQYSNVTGSADSPQMCSVYPTKKAAEQDFDEGQLEDDGCRIVKVTVTEVTE